MGSIAPTSVVVHWVTKALTVDITIDNDSGVPYIQNVQPASGVITAPVSPHFSSSAVPLNGVRLAGQGHGLAKTAKSLVGSVLSSRMRYVRHVTRCIDSGQALDVVSLDHMTGLQATHSFEVYDAAPVLRCWSTLCNEGKDVVEITQASSFSIGGLTQGIPEWWREYTVFQATNSWFREAQWHEYLLPELGIDQVGLLALNQGHKATMARYSLSNQGED